MSDKAQWRLATYDELVEAASLRSEVSELLYVCNKCGFSGTTSPHRGCNYFAAPAPPRVVETAPSDTNRLAWVICSKCEGLRRDARHGCDNPWHLPPLAQPSDPRLMIAPSEVMSRLANLGIDSDDLIGTIRSLRTDLEAANRERDELAKWVELAEKKISDSDAQLEAANTIINAWVRHSPMCSILIKPSCDCGLHAALSSYRRSPDSNTETRR
jgi:hypothetical protein